MRSFYSPRFADEQYNIWRRAVYARDKNECIACGSIAADKRGIHAHHLSLWSLDVASRYNIANGRTLCGFCHGILHPWMTHQKGFQMPEEVRRKIGEAHRGERSSLSRAWAEKNGRKIIKPRGDAHGMRKHPERSAWSRAWSVATGKTVNKGGKGAANGMNTRPDRRPTGDRNGMRQHPERSRFSPTYCEQTGKPPVPHPSGDRNRFSKAYCERTGKPPVEPVRGERHGTHTKPERVARGDRHGSKTHPEKVIRGDAHWTRQHPEKRATGERHGTKTHLGCLPQGENRKEAVLTADLVRALRHRHNIIGESFAALAREIGVSKNTVMRAVKGITYKNVSDDS